MIHLRGVSNHLRGDLRSTCVVLQMIICGMIMGRTQHAWTGHILFACLFSLLVDLTSFASCIHSVSLARYMSRTSPFSPKQVGMPSAADASAEEEASEEDRSSDAEDERNGKRKAQLMPARSRSEEGDPDAPGKPPSRRSRSRKSRSRRSKDRSRGRSRARKKKKNSSKEEKQERDRTRDRRGEDCPNSPRGKPPPKPQEQGRDGSKQSPHKGSKGQGKTWAKGNQKQTRCEICKTKISAHPAAIDQHQWLNEYCLACQAYNRMTPTQRQKSDSWQKAQEVAKKVKGNRTEPSASVARERVPVVDLESESGMRQTRSVAGSPEVPRGRDRHGEPRKEKKRRKASSSGSRSVSPKRSQRHNVVINFR